MVFVVAVFLEQEGLKLEGSVSAEALEGIARRVLVVVGMGGVICCESSFFPWVASPQWLEQETSYGTTDTEAGVRSDLA